MNFNENPRFFLQINTTQEQVHAITSSYDQSINMMTHRWPYGPCLKQRLHDNGENEVLTCAPHLLSPTGPLPNRCQTNAN